MDDRGGGVFEGTAQEEWGGEGGEPGGAPGERGERLSEERGQGQAGRNENK